MHAEVFAALICAIACVNLMLIGVLVGNMHWPNALRVQNRSARRTFTSLTATTPGYAAK